MLDWLVTGKLGGARSTASIGVCATLAIWSVAGCSAITVTNPTDAETVSVHPFIVEVTSGSNPVLVTARGFGLFRSVDGYALGWRSEERVVIPQHCVVVLVIRSMEQLQAAQAVAESIEGACVVEPSANNGGGML